VILSLFESGWSVGANPSPYILSIQEVEEKIKPFLVK